jgi:hypothetical protein
VLRRRRIVETYTATTYSLVPSAAALTWLARLPALLLLLLL